MNQRRSSRKVRFALDDTEKLTAYKNTTQEKIFGNSHKQQMSIHFKFKVPMSK